MKRFNLRGNSANWGALKVSALNTKTEEHENRSEIPFGMKITVRVVNNYYRVYDKRVRQILHGEISAEDNAELISRLTRKHRPDFILFHEGEVIGVANYHRRGWYRRMLAEQAKPKTYTFEVTLKSKVSVEARNYDEAVEMVYGAVDTANTESEVDNANLEIVDIVEI